MSNKYVPYELGKTVRLTNFKKLQLQSVSIFFTFLHQYLHFYLLCFLPLILMFSAVIFVLPETHKGLNPLGVSGFAQFGGSSHSLKF